MDFRSYLIKTNVLEEGKIDNEKDFKEYAKKMFEKAFGDKLDTEKMNKIINGILKDDSEWNEKIGKLQQSFD